MLRGPVLIAVAFAVTFAWPAAANHPQTAHGDVIVFDHKSGNEWWVEVTLGGGASGSVASVKAMDIHLRPPFEVLRQARPGSSAAPPGRLDEIRHLMNHYVRQAPDVLLR